MRILVITSRYTASRDTVKENFGRQMRLFEALTKYGHKIDFYCFDYYKKENRNAEMNGLRIMIRPFERSLLGNLLKFWTLPGVFGKLNRTVRNGKYDLIIATAEPIWGLFGLLTAGKNKKKFLYDLHDNYEIYTTYREIPFYGSIDRKVIRKADIVTTVSDELRKKIAPVRAKGVYTIPNGADITVFKPMSRTEARKTLRIKKEEKIIAYTGTLQKAQGVDILVDAFNTLKKDFPKARLILAGNNIDRLRLDYSGINHFGSVPQKKVVQILNAADLLVLPYRENLFTKYCFPYKVIEYMATNVDIVATRVGDMKNLLAKEAYCEPGNAEKLAEKIKERLKRQAGVSYREKVEKEYTWKAIAGKLDNIIKGMEDE
jgi:glycosyltransferase involved in cell wall biosynthesis